MKAHYIVEIDGMIEAVSCCREAALLFYCFVLHTGFAQNQTVFHTDFLSSFMKNTLDFHEYSLPYQSTNSASTPTLDTEKSDKTAIPCPYWAL
jgi:hypothetical protein